MAQINSIPWSDYFDHIYCFNFLPNVARRKAMEKELERVGILQSGIFSFFHSSPDPWERCIERIVPRTSPESKSNIGFVNLGLATARALREAKWLGYGRVLFLEDDVRFLKDISSLDETISGSPWERNIIQYDKFVDWDMSANEYRRLTASRRIGNTEFFDGGDMFLPSGACFAADAVGMEKMLEYLQTIGPRPVDGIFGLIDVSRAVAMENAAVQVLFGDALVMKYIGDNSHHKAYKPQGIDYRLYEVPDGYDYRSTVASL